MRRYTSQLREESGMSFTSALFLLFVIGGIASWFLYLKPFFLDQKISLANQKLEFNKFSEAEAAYHELVDKVPESQRQTLRDRISQIPLAQKFIADIAPQHPGIDLQIIEAVTGKIGLIYVRYAIQNNTKSALPIRRSLFYLKSNMGKCEVALDRPQNTEVNSWQGDLLPSEKADGAICVKYILVDPNEKLFLVYNNGQIYVNTPLPMDRLSGLSSAKSFTEEWQGRKITSESKPSVPQATVKPQAQTPPEQPLPQKNPVSENIKEPSSKTIEQPKQPVQSAPIKTAPVKQNPGAYTDSQNHFSIQIPQNWQKVERNNLPNGYFARNLGFVALFKGPEWQGNFPLLIIQKFSMPMGSVQINSQVLNDMEKDIRRSLGFSGIQIKQLNSRTTLIGNIQAGEIDLTFSYQDQTFQMKSYVLEGRSGFLISYLAKSSDFNSNSNQAIQAIRSFQNI